MLLPTFWLRCIAAALDFLLMALPIGVAVSFYSIFTNASIEFTQLGPGESPSQVAHSFGRPFLYALLIGYIVGNWLYFAALEHVDAVRAIIREHDRPLAPTVAEELTRRLRELSDEFLALEGKNRDIASPSIAPAK